MGSRDVKVGEVGRIGLVKVIIDFEERGARFRDYGKEKCARSENRRTTKAAMVKYGREDANLFSPQS